MHVHAAVRFSEALPLSFSLQMKCLLGVLLKELFLGDSSFILFYFICQAPSSILESLETHMNGLEDVKGGKKG